MRKLILVLIAHFAVICNAQSGWDYWNLSVLYGSQYQYGQNEILHDYELLLDRGAKSCLSGPVYYGLGLIHRKDAQTEERSLKAYFNPFHRRHHRVFLGVGIIPHISLEGIRRTEETPHTLASNLYLRPSIGFHTLAFRGSVITWKSYVEIGFSSFSAYTNRVSRLSATLKVGMGLNPTAISTMREKRRRKLAKKHP